MAERSKAEEFTTLKKTSVQTFECSKNPRVQRCIGRTFEVDVLQATPFFEQNKEVTDVLLELCWLAHESPKKFKTFRPYFLGQRWQSYPAISY